MNKHLLSAAALNDEQLLEALIPGNNAITQEMRAQILSFIRNPAARGALIVGPIGSGKSTVARIIALMRYLYFCSDERRQLIVENLKFDGPFRIDKRLLNWFEEINLTGLSVELAHAQLFGMAKRGATGVDEKLGIFEQAMYGHSSKEKQSDASRITGGVVLLDELGDFSPVLQPLLLLLLTNAEVFRVGGEGNPKYGYTYTGVTLGATWKDPLKAPFNRNLRPDLLSRLAGYVIRMPELNDRPDEFRNILSAMVEDIMSAHSNHLNTLELESPELVSRAKIKNERLRRISLNDKSIRFLQDQDWSQRGDLRGLRQILERSFYEGIDPIEVFKSAACAEESEDDYDLVGRIISDIGNGESASTLTRELNRLEGQMRSGIADRLRSQADVRRQVAERLGIEEPALRRELANLTRERRNRK